MNPDASVVSEAEPSYLAERQAWFVRLRWVAVLGVFVVVLLATRFGWVRDPAPLLIVAAGMAVANGVFTPLRSRIAPRHGKRLLGIQILTDIGSLTLLLHWSGGVENPFAAFYVFPVTIGAMLFSTRSSYALALCAIALYGSTVIAESLGYLPHLGLSLEPPGPEAGAVIPWSSPIYVTGHLVAFGTMLIGVVAFVRSVEKSRSRASLRARERERIALSRERMARIGQISSGVSHTIRNPLQGVLSCIELLRGNGANPQDKEVLDMMWEGAKRIEEVTHRLLSLTRAEQLRRQMVTPRTLLEEACRFVPTRTDARAVKVLYEMDDLPEVWLDPDQLVEALTNLVDNAVFACRERGDVVLRAAIRSGPDTPRLVIEIEDGGEGITEEAQLEVFNPFYSTKDIGMGTGLGMAIARRAIERHGGEIELSSQAGVGTVVRISLPLPEAPKQETIPQ
jgi:signal transduction histidine kinase